MTSSPFSKPAEEPAPALRALLGSIVDYAGLFPPAGLGMADAVENFASERHGRQSWMLGSFVVPVSRLDELEEAAHARWSTIGEGDFWSLSVILSGDPVSDLEPLQTFRDRWRGRAVVGSLEVPPLSPEEIHAVVEQLPPDRSVFFEVPLDEQAESRLDAIASTGAFAKVRTGGLRREAIPGLESVARFVRACRDRGVPFKATAGLHHPLRGDYRLTYEADSDSTVMHGFLNVAVTAALLSAGALPDDRVCDALAEPDPTAFRFTGRELAWRQYTLPLEGIARSRRSFYQSFGSCSFREPVADLESLELL